MMAFLLPLARALGLVHVEEAQVESQVADTISNEKAKEEVPYSNIEGLADFKWMEHDPIILHPYKAPYNLAFGMERISVSELLVMDNTYLANIQERKQIMNQHPDLVLGAADHSKVCVEELYEWMTRKYLPIRFPTMFELRGGSAAGEPPTHLANLVDGEVYLLTQSSLIDMLKIIGSLVDEDLLFMLPSDDGDGYSLAAFVNCFANGPHTVKRMGMKLRDIHQNVPGYHEHLAKRLDKWFDSLSVGKIVMRSNWAITDSNKIFIPTGHISFKGLVGPDPSLEGSKLFIRTERQTLRRLPLSGAIIFSLKTYLFPTPDIKKAGLGKDLLSAVEGLDKGNAPGMIGYKKSQIWADALRVYMESE